MADSLVFPSFSRRQQSLLICACLTLATLAVYWPVHRFEFINYDDNVYLVENSHLQEGLTFRGLAWAATTPLDLWMPLTWSIRLLEYQWFGLNAGAFHLVNVLFHVVNTLLLFGVFRRMTGATWRSASVAALFALHPLHVEAVAWVTSLKDVLSTCLGLLTVWTYARYVQQLNLEHQTSDAERLTPTASQSPAAAIHFPPSAFHVLSLFLFALALMAKPMMITLPLVLLLLDYWPLGRTAWGKAQGGKRKADSISRLIVEKLPFLVLSAVTGVVTIWAQRAEGPFVSLEKLPFSLRIANGLLAYVGYLGKTFWPTKLAVFYPLETNMSPSIAAAAGLGLLGLTTAILWGAQRAPSLVTGWFWYLGMLVPVVGLVQVGVGPAMADRYTYMPLVGVFVMLSWSLPGPAMERGVLRVAVCGVAVAALAICGCVSRIQVEYWQNTETLFRQALRVTRNNWLAHNNLGIALGRTGRIDEAIEQCEQAVRIKPDFAEGHYNLGVALGQTGRLPEARVHYEQALELKPDLAEAHYSLGNLLFSMGAVSEAIVHFQQSLRVKPDFAVAHYNLGVALQREGQLPEAMEHYAQTVHLNPDAAQACNNWGIALKDSGRLTEAIERYEQALRVDPNYPEAHYNLGVALEEMGRVTEAIEHYQQAARLKPGFAEAQNRLAQLRSVR